VQSNASAVAATPDELDAATATALTTQYANSAAAEMVNLHTHIN
jgi:hypothetical protein